MIDIQEAIDVNQTPIDLTTAYEHLMEGSKNHLRAFVDALDSQLDYDYDEAQLLDQELFDAIIYIYWHIKKPRSPEGGGSRANDLSYEWIIRQSDG